MTAEVLPEEAVSQEIRFLWSSLIMLTPLPLQNFFEEPPIAQSNVNFTDMNLSRSLLKVSICDRPILIIVWLPRFCHNIQAVHAIGFDSPTPIQVAAVPMALLGKDICACAATGTGLYYYSIQHTHTQMWLHTWYSSARNCIQKQLFSWSKRHCLAKTAGCGKNVYNYTYTCTAGRPWLCWWSPLYSVDFGYVNLTLSSKYIQTNLDSYFKHWYSILGLLSSS